MTILKMIVQLLMTILAGVVPAVADHMNFTAWVNVIILGAGVIMVYNAGNLPGWNYAKLIASAVSAVAVLLVSSMEGGFSTAEIIQMILAAFAAIGVGALPNSGTVAVARRPAA